MTVEELKQHCVRQITEFERIKKIMPVTPNGYKHYEEHKMVLQLIEASEQAPNEDCISREATVRRLCKVADFMNEKRSGLGSPYIMAALFIQDNKDEFPPVTPKEKTWWIPVSERLPERVEWYLTSIKWNDGTKRVIISWFDGTSFKAEVIAWMPLPEPMKEGDDQDGNKS